MADNEIKIIVSADIEQATQALSQLGKQLENAFAGSTSSVTKKLQVVTQTTQKFAQQASKAAENISLNDMLKDTGMSINNFNQYLKDNYYAMDRNGNITDKLSGQVLKNSQVVRKAAMEAKRFNFAWLSVMFTGMALDRVFGGLVRAQFELFGVTDMMSSMWTVVLMPVMEVLIPIIYWLIEAFMNMPEPMKIIVGSIVLLGAIFGKFLATLGMVKMGWAALVQVFAPVAAAIKGFFASSALAGTPLLTVIGAIIAVIAGIALIVKGVAKIFKGEFEGIGLVIMGIGAILLLFIGWWALIPIAVGAVVYAVIKHWDNVKNFFITLWANIVNIFKGAWDLIKTVFVAVNTWLLGLWKGLWDKFKDVVKGFGDFFKSIWEGIKSIFKGIINFFIWGINSWLQGLESMINFVIKGLNQLIRLLNKIPGVKIGSIDTVSFGKIPSFKTGGIMPETGLAYLHAGEKVIPKNQVDNSSVVFSPVINVTTNSNASSYDISRAVSEELNRQWSFKFKGR